MRRALVLAMLVTGCQGRDPCASAGAQTCLALEVRWATGERLVDQIAVRALEGFTLDGRTPPQVGDAFELPVVVPIELGTFQGAFRVAVRALRSDGEIGAGELAAEIPKGAHRRHRVTLTPAASADGGSDDGGTDGGMGRIQLSVRAANETVEEHDKITLTIIARDGNGPVIDYNSPLTFSADWGSVRVITPPTFVDGQATATVSLDRETTDNFAHIIATDGTIAGTSQDLTVKMPAWTIIDANPILVPGGAAFDSLFIKSPSWVRKDGVYHLFYYGNGGTANRGWGLATSTTGAAWVHPVFPSFVAATTGWAADELITQFRPQWDGTQFVAAYTVAFRGMAWTTSPDGYGFTHAAQPLATRGSTGCPYDPVSRALSLAPLRIYLDEADSPCYLESGDGGLVWSAQTPTSGFPGSWGEGIADLRHDGDLYRLWYWPSSVGMPQTGYATSTDGIAWVLSRAPPAPLMIESVLWNPDLERFEGLFMEGMGIYRAVRP